MLDEAVKYNNEDTHTYTHRSTHIHLQTHTYTHTQSSLATPTHLHRNGVLKIMQMNSYSSASPGCLAGRGSPLSFSSTPTECAEIKRMYKKKKRKSKRKKKERGEDTTAQQGRGADIMNVVN